MSAVERINLSHLSGWLTDKAAAMRAPDLRKLFDVVHQILVSGAKMNFVRSSAPDGTPWAPLKKERRRNKGKSLPLRDTGLLMASLQGGPKHIDVRRQTGLQFGTSVDYAAFHQFGTKFIPARPFLGLNAKLIKSIGSAFARAVVGDMTGNKP